MAVENEYKFTSDDADPEFCISALESFLKDAGAVYSKAVKSYLDRYYDSDGLEIAGKGCFIRERIYRDGKCKLTVKRPISVNGAMSREEIERASDGTFGTLSDFCDECFPGMILCKDPVLTNVCERTIFSLENEFGIKLSFDMCQYVDGDKTKDYSEIELEVVSDTVVSDFDEFGVKVFVTDALGFRQVTESKFIRGLRWKGQTGRRFWL